MMDEKENQYITLYAEDGISHIVWVIDDNDRYRNINEII